LAAMPGDLLNREASMLTKLGDEQTSITGTL
jgi:hypothetical protein